MVAEVDLTGPSPVKKLKQPRLSFGPVKKDGEENTKKRKIDDEENTPNKKGKPEASADAKIETTPLKSANIVNKSPVKNKSELSTKTKSILSAFVKKDGDKVVENEAEEVKEDTKDAKKDEQSDKRKKDREIKPKKKAKVEDKEDEGAEMEEKEKKSGSIKMPWKGKKGKNDKEIENKEVIDIDDNSADFFNIDDDEMEDDVVINEEKEVEEEHEEDKENNEELEDELAWLKQDNDEENTPVSLSPRKKRNRKSTSKEEKPKTPKTGEAKPKTSSIEKIKTKTPTDDETKPKTPITDRKKSVKTTTPKITPEEKAEQEKKKAEKEKEKLEEKERKEKEKLEEKERKEKEKADGKEAKERRKSLANEEKEQLKAEAKLAKEKLENEEKEKAKAPVPIKESPLFKFLVKAKPGPIPPKPVKPVDKETVKPDEDDIEVVPDESVAKEDVAECESEPPLRKTAIRASPRKTPKVEDNNPKVEDKTANEELKTPVRASPRKKSETPTIASMFKTPKGSLTPKMATPKSSTTPISGSLEEANKLSAAKLRVQIISLNDDIDAAVAEKDFLKAHELKQKITGLEEEMKKIEEGSPSPPALASKIADPSPKTPKGTGRKTSVTTPSSATPGSTPGSNDKKMTPKQIAYREELRKKREEKEMEKEKLSVEKKKKFAELKAEKEKEKQEKERQKEIEKRVKEVERMEKEREKEKERKEKEAQKEIEKQEKEEEKAKKKAELEEAKLQKQKEREEEKRKAEEEKKKAEEAEKEKQTKTVQAFKGFFVKKDVMEVEKTAKTEEISQMEEGGNFTPFRLKSNMRMAPLVRNDPVLAKMRIDSLESPSGPSGLYLEILKTSGYQPKNGQCRTWPLKAKNGQESDDDIEILDDDEEEEEVDEDAEAEKEEDKASQKSYKRAKLFQFHENQRPAYWGTFTKKHNKINGRKPFARDDVLFDYDYDSDEDWEEEEQGESLSDDEEKDKEEEDDYEVDNKFFVPHGYLSDEEEDKDDDEVFNPDTAKEKLKLKEEEFAAEQKKKTKTIKPHIWGCHWEDEEVDTSAAAAQLIKILNPYSCIMIGNNNHEPIDFIDTIFTKTSSPEGEVKDEDAAKCRGRPGGKRFFPEEAMPDIIKLIHANPNSKVFLHKEFIEFWKKKTGGDSESNHEAVVGTPATPSGCLISKKCTVDKITEIADYKKMEELGDKSGRVWVVKPEVLEKYKVTPSFPNDWTYLLEPPVKPTQGQDEGGVSRPDSPTAGAKNQPPNPASLITKFTKILTEEERAKILAKPVAPVVPVVAVATEPQGIGKFAVKLTEEEHQKKMATPIDVKKTPGGAKTTPIATKKTPGGAKSTPASAKATPIATKKTPGSAKATPIATKKTPGSAKATPIATNKTPGSTKTTPIATKKTPGSAKATTVETTSTKKKAGGIEKFLGAKASPIAIKKTPSTATPKTATPIAVKKTPKSATTKANPIATKKTKTPKAVTGGTPTSTTSAKGGRRMSLTPMRSSPRKTPPTSETSEKGEPMDVECITVE